MSQKGTQEESDEIEATRRVGLIASYHVEFGAVVERHRGNKRRVRYDVRINGYPSSASIYVEGDQKHASLCDAEVEAANAHIQKFLRDGITDGIEVILREALQLTHTKGEFTDKAFLRDVFDYLREASDNRLKSGVAKRKRRDWRKFEATAKVRRDTAFFKEYRAEYKRLYVDYTRTTHQRSDQRFVKDAWREHERKAFSGRSGNYLKLALRVAKGDLTPKQAALEWVSDDLRLSADTLERHYLYRRQKKPAETR